jgi:hypothetical protein
MNPDTRNSERRRQRPEAGTIAAPLDAAATRAPSSYNAAALKAAVSSRRSAALIGGRSSQSMRWMGAVMEVSGHSWLALSASDTVATSPELS